MTKTHLMRINTLDPKVGYGPFNFCAAYNTCEKVQKFYDTYLVDNGEYVHRDDTTGFKAKAIVLPFAITLDQFYDIDDIYTYDGIDENKMIVWVKNA